MNAGWPSAKYCCVICEWNQSVLGKAPLRRYDNEQYIAECLSKPTKEQQKGYTGQPLLRIHANDIFFCILHLEARIGEAIISAICNKCLLFNRTDFVDTIAAFLSTEVKILCETVNKKKEVIIQSRTHKDTALALFKLKQLQLSKFTLSGVSLSKQTEAANYFAFADSLVSTTCDIFSVRSF